MKPTVEIEAEVEVEVEIESKTERDKAQREPAPHTAHDSKSTDKHSRDGHCADPVGSRETIEVASGRR